MREVELYSNVEGAVKILVANKVDLVSRRRQEEVRSLCGLLV